MDMFMGGHWNKRGGSYKEIDTEGTGGETQDIPISISPLHSPGFWDSFHDEESTGRRKRTKPYGVTLHGGKAAIGETDLPQGVCANCGTNFLAAFRCCYECGGATRAPSEQEIIEACRQARAG